jgi:hypothetical protein
VYGSEVWGVGNKFRDSDPFEHLQLKFIKEGSITFKCNRLHYNYFAIFMITLHYITITSIFKCNRLNYNHFVNVIDYITDYI